MEQLLESLRSIAIPLAASIMLVAIFIASKTIAEYSATAVLIFTLGFYHTESLQMFIAKLPILKDLPLSDWLQGYHNFIITRLPEFEGFTIFDRTFLSINVHENYVATQLPIILLFLGIVVRTVIDRYVKHTRLKQLGREYWLFITAYLVLAAIISTLIQWSFLKILIASIVIVFIVVAGLFRVGTDFISGLWSSLHVFRRTIKIVAMYIALAGTKITKALRDLVRFVRELYEKYLIKPFRELYKKIQDFLDGVEEQIQSWLDNERLDD